MKIILISSKTRFARTNPVSSNVMKTHRQSTRRIDFWLLKYEIMKSAFQSKHQPNVLDTKSIPIRAYFTYGVPYIYEYDKQLLANRLKCKWKNGPDIKSL